MNAESGGYDLLGNGVVGHAALYGFSPRREDAKNATNT